MDSIIVKRTIITVPKQSFFLLGPRGTGKTTWLKENFSDSALWIDFNDPEAVRFYSAKPERLKETVSGEPGKNVIIIDEVQRVPDILPVVHSLIEERKNLQFILTGSSARKLKRAGVDLLAGRALLKNMHPFIASEISPN